MPVPIIAAVIGVVGAILGGTLGKQGPQDMRTSEQKDVSATTANSLSAPGFSLDPLSGGSQIGSMGDPLGGALGGQPRQITPLTSLPTISQPSSMLGNGSGGGSFGGL